MDDTRKELLRSWLTKAASDLRSARVLGSADDAPLDTAIYHCQQTAEKAMKAFLVSKAEEGDGRKVEGVRGKRRGGLREGVSFGARLYPGD